MKIKFNGTIQEFIDLAEKSLDKTCAISVTVDSATAKEPTLVHIVGVSSATYEKGGKIGAIKELRELGDMALKAAKDKVEEWMHATTHGIECKPIVIGQFKDKLPRTTFLTVEAK